MGATGLTGLTAGPCWQALAQALGKAAVGAGLIHVFFFRFGFVWVWISLGFWLVWGLVCFVFDLVWLFSLGGFGGLVLGLDFFLVGL